MVRSSRSVHHAPRWVSIGRKHNPSPPPGIRVWLEDTGSLTQRVLTACNGQFSVHVRRQESARSYYDEAGLLNANPSQFAVIREVELRCDDAPWVFARTIIPTSSLRGPAKRLTMLGNKPLGAVLFADPSVIRGRTQFSQLKPGQKLFESAVAGLSSRPDSLWGRRTLFYLADKPLLVNEIFLPGIPL